MATTYETLKTEIANFTHRADLTSQLDTFIDMAEAKMNRNLRMSEMENSTAVTLTSGTFTLPTGFVEMREVHVTASPNTTLEYVTPFQMTMKKKGETGTPKYYTIYADGGETYPADGSTLGMVFYKSITPLDSTNTTNFLLTSHPDLYLHGTLQQAFIYTQDENAAAMHGQEFMRLMDEINKTSRRRKFSGVPLQVVAA